MKPDLKAHCVGKTDQKLLHSAGDIEGHLGIDNRLYLVDLARAFPPEYILG
jgi:hypothetical protein